MPTPLFLLPTNPATQPVLILTGTIPPSTAAELPIARPQEEPPSGQGDGSTGQGGGEPTTPPAPGGLGQLLVPVVAIFAIFYFVLIRPERKKQQARQSMLERVKKGTKVMTTSGMYGSVAQIQEDVVTLQVADGVRLRFNRAAIQEVVEEKEGDGKAAKGGDEQPEDGSDAK